MSCAWPRGCEEGNMPGGQDYRTRDLGLAAPAWLSELLMCPVFPWGAPRPGGTQSLRSQALALQVGWESARTLHAVLLCLSCFPAQHNGGLVASCYRQAHLILLLLWGVIKEIKSLVRPLWGQRKGGRKIAACIQRERWQQPQLVLQSFHRL